MFGYPGNGYFTDTASTASEKQWQQAGQMIKDHYNDKDLREKALMYAVQAMPHVESGTSAIGLAELFLDFLRGEREE